MMEIPLPESVKEILWDCDPIKLTWAENGEFISMRILTAGGRDSIKWLRSQLSNQELVDLITTCRGRGLDPKRLRYWQLILGLPGKDVDGWVAAYQESSWGRRTSQ